MPRQSDRAASRGDGYLTETLRVRLTPNDMAWLDSVARGMDPPVDRSYVARAIIVAWRCVGPDVLETFRGLQLPHEAQESIRGQQGERKRRAHGDDASGPASTGSPVL